MQNGLTREISHHFSDRRTFYGTVELHEIPLNLLEMFVQYKIALKLNALSGFEAIRGLYILWLYFGLQKHLKFL